MIEIKIDGLHIERFIINDVPRETRKTEGRNETKDETLPPLTEYWARSSFPDIPTGHPVWKWAFGYRDEALDLRRQLAAAKAARDLPPNTMTIKVHDEIVRDLQYRLDKALEDLDTVTKPATNTVDATGVLNVSHPNITVPVKRIRNSVLTKEEVWAIRRFIKLGRTNAWINNHLNITNKSTVWKIRVGQTYADYPEEPARKPTTVHAGEGVVEQGEGV